jgi:hypothetical protein
MRHLLLQEFSGSSSREVLAWLRQKASAGERTEVVALLCLFLQLDDVHIAETIADGNYVVSDSDRGVRVTLPPAEQ